MKNLKLIAGIATLIAITAIIIFAACRKDSNNTKKSEKKYVINNIENMGDYCWVPPNAEVIEDYHNQTILISSSNWTYIGTTSDNQLLMLNKGDQIKISCTCNSSGSCYPFYVNEIAGCAGDCSKCTMTQSVTTTGKHITHGGYVNLEIEPHFITKDEELPTAFDEMFNIPEINNKINTFITNIYKGYEYPKLINKDDYILTPDNYSFAVINLCGRAIVLPVPDDILPQNSISGNKFQCSCTDGTCLHKVERLIIHYCKDNCSGTCTMTVSVATTPEIDDHIRFSSISFQY